MSYVCEFAIIGTTIWNIFQCTNSKYDSCQDNYLWKYGISFYRHFLASRFHVQSSFYFERALSLVPYFNQKMVICCVICLNICPGIYSLQVTWHQHTLVELGQFWTSNLMRLFFLSLIELAQDSNSKLNLRDDSWFYFYKNKLSKLIPTCLNMYKLVVARC